MYEWVINSISPKLLHLVRANCYISLKCEMPKKIIGGLELFNIKCNNFWIRKTLIKKFSCHPKAFYKWKLNYPFHSTIKIWAGINTFLLPNKMKELHYKILHMYYPCNSLLSNLSWNSLHNAHSVILTWKQYHIYFLNVIMQTIYENKYLGLFSQLTTNSLVLK